MANGYWDTEVDLTPITKNEYSEYRITACTKGESMYINIREFYWSAAQPTPMPGKQGICIPVKGNGCPSAQLIASIEEGIQYFKDEGLL